jgi:hypothetical protein
MIPLPQGGQFNEAALVAHIRSTDRDYIIQGQQSVTLRNHSKPDSLDYWLRLNGAANRNTKQAENPVLDALVNTGQFVIVHRLWCPNSGTRCKGVRLRWAS